MPMNRAIVDLISKEIYKRFPEFRGSRPKVRKQRSSQNKATNQDTYLLTFQTKASLPGAESLSRWVRVTAKADGKIIKISTSR